MVYTYNRVFILHLSDFPVRDSSHWETNEKAHAPMADKLKEPQTLYILILGSHQKKSKAAALDFLFSLNANLSKYVKQSFPFNIFPDFTDVRFIQPKFFHTVKEDRT